MKPDKEHFLGEATNAAIERFEKTKGIEGRPEFFLVLNVFFLRTAEWEYDNYGKFKTPNEHIEALTDFVESEVRISHKDKEEGRVFLMFLLCASLAKAWASNFLEKYDEKPGGTYENMPFDRNQLETRK